MLLAIDSGNTNIVFAVYDTAAGQVLGEWRASSSNTGRTADEFAVWLTQGAYRIVQTGIFVALWRRRGWAEIKI